MEKTRSLREMRVGDAAVEGLLNGIIAGLVMGVVVIAIEMVAGANPFQVLTYFSVAADASPLLGLFTHVAVSGIYGVIFGIAAMLIARQIRVSSNLGVWLGVGIVYGLLILGIAKAIVLPQTTSPLRDLPIWAFGIAHIVYGVALGWLTHRSQ